MGRTSYPRIPPEDLMPLLCGPFLFFPIYDEDLNVSR